MNAYKKYKMILTILLLTLTIGSIAYAQTNIVLEPAKQKVETPELPPIWEIYKIVNKEAFQPNLNSDHVTNTEGLTINTVATENTERSLRGFRGYNYTDEVNGNSAIVLHHTLHISSEGNWKVQGLVRNETTKNVGTISVTVQLLSDKGTVLETLSTQSLVKNIRPGEPAPFIIHSSTPANQVKDVKWSVGTENAEMDISRDANIMTDYELKFGSDTYRSHKRDDPPYPYVLATAFDNLGRALKSAEIVVAWIDQTGKVIQIRTSTLDDGFKNGVPEGGAASFKNIVEHDPVIGQELGKNPYTMWVMGR